MVCKHFICVDTSKPYNGCPSVICAARMDADVLTCNAFCPMYDVKGVKRWTGDLTKGEDGKEKQK